MGFPFKLGCNVTVKTGDSVKQVRWVDPHDQILVAYKPDEPSQIFSQRQDVMLDMSRAHGSVITVRSAALKDGGCYRCVFDIYPSGAEEGKTCLHIAVEVGLEGNKSAVSGERGSLGCSYGVPETVHQVLWRKEPAEQGGAGGSVVASYAKRGQPTVEEAFAGRLTLSHSLGVSQLTFLPTRLEDEGCYTCQFHTFPEGSKSATACLSVYVLPEPEVSSVTASPGVIQANCTAQARPAAAMAWNVEGDNRTLGPSVSSSYQQADGTTLVVSTLLFQSALLSDLTVKCMVQHPGLEHPMTVALNTVAGPALAVVISVSCVAALLLVCVCVALCRCLFCRDD